MNKSLELLLPALLLGLSWVNAGAYALRGYVVGNGAMPAAGSTNGSFAVLGTLGQAVVGEGTNGSVDVRHGYWSFGGPRVVAVIDPPAGVDLPRELSLSRPTPNPSPGDVRFELAL